MADWVDWDDFGGAIKSERRAKRVDALKSKAKVFGVKVNSFGAKIGAGASKLGSFASSLEPKGKGKKKNRGLDFDFGKMFKL